MKFSHLHNHTQFSLLDGASSINGLFAKAKADNMPAVAITDHGNMFGVFDFVATANKFGVKPIVGCEFYVVEDHTIKSFTKERKDRRYHQLLLAKNKQGYQNLTKLCSLGYMEGLYGKYPRITKALIEKYKEGLIATTCCIGARVPQEILKHGEDAGKKELKWWLDLFGEDYYVEIQRHDIPEQNTVNKYLLKWAKEFNIKVIASNDSHYVDQDDWVAHDILLCVNTNEKLSTPKMKDFDEEGGSKDTRFAFYNDQFYFKNTAEMTQLFSDIPEAIDNTNEVVGKVETLKLKQDILLPNFPIPEEFKKHDDDKLNQWEYLQHLTFEGAKARYGEISEEVRERLDFELFTIKTMGFAGYFLIVMDFIKAGRDLGVMIGPGRGSAAGSAVAYCIGITNIDPVKYNLLFERFLNPDRKSMPDIDTDFDDEGRQRVIDYVVDKYGKNQVAQIITYGTMATKSAIKDVARVMELPLSDANYIAKLVPDKPSYGINFKKLIHFPEFGKEGSLEKLGLSADEIENVRKVREFYHGKGLESKVLKQAEKLEGTVRNTGVHAAGVIIAPYDLSDIVPVSTSKDADLLVTQYEGKIIEDAGVIKMDFLGLRNLTIIKEALRMIKENHGVEIEIDDIPLDDEKTFELFQRGETNAIFQFESDGMKKYMKELKPDRFDDLIAMNALYRPGPLAYIPSFIRRKHGREEITYDLPEMEEYLAETYGITVYQEQVMLLSQKLANFTKGDADVLRKAMGKKLIDVLNKLKAKFMEGGAANGHPEKTLEKVWKDWEAFAQYAFNKSHSTCYAFVAYQTAYLKTHYPSEYMAGVLTSCLGNIDKITFFMEECRSLGLPVLGPDVNESVKRFGVNKNGEIRFGLGGIKGTGDAAVEAIIEEREENGKYKDVYDFITRVNLRTVNKKTLESLVYAGAFDSFEEFHRSQYFETENGSGPNFIEVLIRYANKINEEKNSAQASLFGGGLAGGTDMAAPKPDRVEPWGHIERLRYEKDVVGFYISGHPLDQFSLEMKICRSMTDLLNPENKDKEFKIGGMITSVQIRQTKNGKPFSIFKMEDYEGSLEIALFGNDHITFSNYLMEGQFLFIRGKVQGRWNNDHDMEFKPIEMQLLTDVKEKQFRSVSIKLQLTQIDESLVKNLKGILEGNPGNFEMQLKVYDLENETDLQFFSRNSKIDINREVEKMLAEICGAGAISFS
ncbi:DNA polymerase III subunit alpha [Marinilongibacter aquaticus]|uniref:DNA polymerase III subunit alpha n=1 Tax=Marinilongibacter aquaticus TaxID=2975157 RepID=UPI0021BD4640|nr:DNA polymerase III subunit alpha [Marinilongibacter aquaticus]UBM59257.1 DNA polymerase III subunit alpha [Marinilongibacter aquaticus]